MAERYGRQEFFRRVGHQAQLGGTRHVTLAEGRAKGMSAIDVDTGGGLMFTVLPDRGMDISLASFKGINLVFLTPNGEAHPAFYEPGGVGWLRTFNGGLLTTCGLTHLGPPCRDGEEELGLHGRHSANPASRVTDTSGWRGDRYKIELTGVVEDAAIFRDKIRLTRTISADLGGRSISIHDRVENFGSAPAPFTILYHMNAGFPLLDAHAVFRTDAKKVEPRDDEAKMGIKNYGSFAPPTPGFKEQVFYHTMRGDRAGRTKAVLINKKLAGGLGLCVRFNVRELPYLTQWKSPGSGEYVLGIEPCNVPCMSRADLRSRGLLPMLAPGGTRNITIEVGILEGKREVR